MRYEKIFLGLGNEIKRKLKVYASQLNDEGEIKNAIYTLKEYIKKTPSPEVKMPF